MTLSTGPKIESRPAGPISSQPQGQRHHLPPRERVHVPTPSLQQQRLGSGISDLNSIPNQKLPGLAEDLLRGADEIADFIFGARGSRRQVYYLAETSRLPVFRLGSVLCARRSVLMQWIAKQESRVQHPETGS
jgi:hypothetical protein